MVTSRFRNIAGRKLLIWAAALLGLVSCTPAPPPTLLSTAEPPVAPPAPPATLPLPTWTPTPNVPTLAPTPTLPPAITIAVDPGAPATLAEELNELIASRPAEFAWSTVESADVVAGFDHVLPLGEWVFAAVAPFPTIPDEIAYTDVVAAWNGAAPGPIAGWSLLLSPDTADALEPRLGGPPIGARLVEPGGLLNAAWSERTAWAIVPFEELEPRWKVLRIDGRSPLDRPLDLSAYPLALRLGLRGPIDKAEKVWTALRALRGPATPLTNRDESRMTVLAMTGVTALVRATAYVMEGQGITYPGEAVAGVLSSADIAHLSNEVSFAPDCPYPSPERTEESLSFCSDDRYLALLEYVGADVIELTGNHVNDWGTAALEHTLALYEERGWGTFGGGANALEAGSPLTVSHSGNTLGFLGCNPAGPQSAWATADSPGSSRCTVQSLATTVAELDPQVDVVIVGIQYPEYYTYTVSAQQRADFLSLAAAGADIVSGSQGHHAQGFALPEGGFVHFGLGNLFFDQMDRLGTRQTFIDRHVIYEGRHIATDLWTGLIENWARPRPMTAPERASLLQSVFAASFW